MKRKIINSLLFTALFSLSLNSCNKKEEPNSTNNDSQEDFDEDELLEDEEIIDIDKENDDEVKDEGEIVGSQEKESYEYKYLLSTNLDDLYDTAEQEHMFEVGENPKLNQITATLRQTKYDSSGNEVSSSNITVDTNTFHFFINGKKINKTYTFTVSDIGEQNLVVSFTYQSLSFSDSIGLVVYTDSADYNEESNLLLLSYPRRKFLVNSNIDFSNLRVARNVSYIGLEEDFTVTKVLESGEYGLLVDDKKYSSSKTYSTSGQHTVKVFYIDKEYEDEINSKTDSQLVQYYNGLETNEKLTFNFNVYQQNEINELVIDPEMLINREYDIGQKLNFTKLNVNYVTEQLSLNNSKANNKSVKPIFSGEYLVKNGNNVVSEYTFTNTNPVTFTLETNISGVSKESSSFTISPVFEASSVVNNYDNSDDMMNVTFTRNKDNSSISNLGLSSNKGYFTPDEVECNFGVRDFVYKTYACPSTGKVPLVIVPVVYPSSNRKIGVSDYSSKDYPSYATSSYWDAIYRAFFGKEGEGELDSLRSYYYKSSYGQLDLCGLMTDYCFIEDDLPDLDSTVVNNLKAGNSFNRATLSANLANWAKTKYNIDSRYDSDNDGVTDAFIFVWIGPRTSEYTCYWDSTNVGNLDSKNKEVVSYLWTSALNTIPYTSSGDYTNSKFKTAVITHEFGHLIGAFDLYPSSNTYYSYSKDKDPQLSIVSSSSSAQYKYAPMGYYDQMDHDVGDHNLYNKMLYGWIKPYIVYGRNVTIDVKSIQHTNSAVILYDDDKQFVKNSNNKIVFSPFDEFLLVDYYTNKNLNKDKLVKQYSISPLQGYGGRICHIDSRLKLSGNYINDCSTLVKNKKSYKRVNKNTYSSDNSYFEEIRWIQSTGFLTCKSLSKAYTNYSLTTESFFLANGIGANKTFSLNGKATTYDQNYSQSFVNGKESKMNNGKVNSSGIKFNSLIYL